MNRKYSELEKLIRIGMIRAKVSQTRLAERLGMSQPAFSKRLRNDRFTYEELKIIFKILKIEDEDILQTMKGA